MILVKPTLVTWSPVYGVDSFYYLHVTVLGYQELLGVRKEQQIKKHSFFLIQTIRCANYEIMQSISSMLFKYFMGFFNQALQVQKG